MKLFTKITSILLALLLLCSCGATTLPDEVPVATAEAAVTDTQEPEQRHLCTLSVDCGTILDNMDKLTEGKETLVPEDGLLLSPQEVEFTPGESVMDLLERELKARNLHFEVAITPLDGAKYVEGICNLYEFDCGELSGWQYRVNGEFPSVSVDKYELSDGDMVEFLYTCDMGADIGDSYQP